MKKVQFDESSSTPAQRKAGEQPRDHRGRFASNRELYLDDDEIPAGIVPWAMQADAIGNPMELGEDKDPFEIVDEMIDLERTGHKLSSDEDGPEEEFSVSGWRPETPEERKERHALSSHRRIEAAKSRYQQGFLTQPRATEALSMAL